MAQKREIYWFALTVFKNLPGLEDAFSKKGWETFRAYTVEETYEGTRVVRKEVPLVRSLLFVRSILHSDRFVRVQSRFQSQPTVLTSYILQ